MQNSLVVFILSVLDWTIPFLDKFHSKNQNCWFKLKFGTFASFKAKVPSLGNFGSKKTESSELAEIFKTNWSIKNSMVVVTFCILNKKHPFLVNFVLKIKYQFKLKFSA